MIKLAIVLAVLFILDAFILYHFIKKGRDDAKTNKPKRTVNYQPSTNN